jgi:hypothetical protein
MADVPLAEQIDTMRRLIAEMEREKRRTPQFERVIATMRAVLDRLLAIVPDGEDQL